MTTIPLKAVANLLEISERRVQQLAADGIIPRAVDGKYELVPTVRGYIGFLKDSRSDRAEESISIRDSRARLLKAQADKTELEVEVLKGKLLDANEVELELSNLILNFRTKILGIASKVAVQLVGKKAPEIQDILKINHVEALIELSKNADQQPAITTEADVSESVAEVKPAARTKNKRVGRPKQKVKQRSKR